MTYTQNNTKEIERKFYGHTTAIPSRIEIMTWFTFLLRELARPYRRVMHDERIEGFRWAEGRSVPYVPETNTAAHYFAGGEFIYSDKVSKFICECERLTGGAVMRRLAQRFDHVFVDEIQDMAGYDLDVLELILKAGIKLSLVGDHRQATLRTNYSKKNSAYAGTNIIKKFHEWHNSGLATLSYEQHTHRCNQDIADLGDSFFPNEPRTRSLNDSVTGHDGVFIVPPSQVVTYVDRFKPQVLRLDKRTPCDGFPAMNFGESKGLTFDRVLIFPHGLGKKWLGTGNLIHVEKLLPKMYVGVTRARFSLAFVLDGDASIPHAQTYSQ
ncbi:DNA helicase-2 / ATP-dependent DNA helicase PcrA [Microvirga guangxiensis]|uniref:DNA helicase-2 / ATP-dependent DNA helicase PcrA n=1 Tax=Microvirga guangxiensis TaxID=549386 RepID=A0A1G5G6N2_9HYPH|nr:DNA helicase-2 / ATP-dependent DNA helicase PcrA [Microvirga guangxiensis]